MTRGIVAWSLTFRALVVAAAALMVAVGVFRLRDGPVDAFPEFAPPVVEVQTEALGLSAGEVEQLVTVPMEELLYGLAWLRTLRSESVAGMSSIRLEFEPGADLMRARALVQERLAQTRGLPTKAVSKPPAMLQPLSSTSEVMRIGLSSTRMSLIDLSVLTRWTIRPRLMGVPGVANVAVWGQRQRQLQVQVDPARLQSNGLSIWQIIRTTGDALWVSPLTFLSASTPGVTGGFVDTPTQRLAIRHVLPISSPADLAQVAVSGAPTLRLGDVTEVVEGHQPLIGDAVVNGGPGLLLVVEKFPWANTVEVTRGVDGALADLQPGLPQVDVDATIFRPATFIELAMANLRLALLVGGGLAALVVTAFLFHWRTVMISLIAVPLSLLAALLVLDLRGTTPNAMVLAGLLIAAGVLVDDAIVDLTSVVRRLRQQRPQGRRATLVVILDGSVEVRGAMIFATAILLILLIPILFMPGPTGDFFRPLAISYGLAVLASTAVALTVTPALALLLLERLPSERRSSPVTRWLQARYDAGLVRTVRRPAAAGAAVSAALAVGLVVSPFLGLSLLPAFNERDLQVRWEGAPGISRPEMVRITTQLTNELRAVPGVRAVGAQIGRAVLGNRVVNVNAGELWVSLDPRADYDATVATIRDVVDGYPGGRRGVQTYLHEQARAALTGAADPVVVRVYGPDMGVLRQKAEEVRQALAGIEGVVDPRIGSQVEEPQIQIQVDVPAAQRYGLTPGDVRRAGAILVNGIEVGSVFEDQKVYELVVVGVPAIAQSVTSLEQMPIEAPDGRVVRLGEIAAVRLLPAQSAIQREAVSRHVDVGAGVRGRDIGAVTREVEARLRAIQFPREYFPLVLGEYVAQQRAQGRVLVLAAAAVLGAFLLLQAAFGSWRLATLLFVTLPPALVGGVLAAYLGGGVISLGSLVGLFTVLGIAARGGIKLLNHYQHLERREGEPIGPELVMRGAHDQSASVLTTALASGLAMMPLIVIGDVPGLEIARPAAVVILGGLVTSTLLTLFAMPALYLRFARPVAPTEDEDEDVGPPLHVSPAPNPTMAGAAAGGGS
jgi:CzcA family heavy metal efflux pump